MATRRDAKSPTTKAEAPAAPPYYIATAHLYIDGNQFARAHNPGDRVSPAHVEKHGWHADVRPPDGYATPEQPPSEPETSSGQATTSSEGKDA